MAAVYNVPLGGALFALEVLLGTLTLPLVLPALATSPDRHRGRLDRAARRPHLRRSRATSMHASQIVWALIAGPVAGLVAVGSTSA